MPKKNEKPAPAPKKTGKKSASPSPAQSTRDEGLVQTAVHKLTGPHGDGKTANLPLISVISDNDLMMETKTQLLRAHELKERVEKDTVELSELKTTLASTQMALGHPGFRWGDKAVSARWQSGRKSFSVEALTKEWLNRGLSLDLLQELIDAATTTGKDYLVVDLREVKL